MYLATALLATSVALIATLAGQLVPARPRAVARRLSELEQRVSEQGAWLHRQRRQERAERLGALLERLGGGLAKGDRTAARHFLIHAGYRNPSSLAIYCGARLGMMASFGVGGFLVTPILGGGMVGAMLAALWCAVLGWMAPRLYVGRRARARQKEIQRALPDALDLLVVCVEAGVGLHQALVGGFHEVRHLSRLTSEELLVVKLENRAGGARGEAMRRVGERTG